MKNSPIFRKMKAICIAISLLIGFSASAEVPAFDSDKPVTNFSTSYSQAFNTTWDGTTFYNQWDMVWTAFDATDIASGYLQFVWDAKRVIRSKSTYSTPYVFSAVLDWSQGFYGGIIVRAKATGAMDALQEPAISDPGFNREGIAFYPTADGQNMVVQFSGVDNGYGLTALTKINVAKPAGVSSLLNDQGTMRIEDFGTSLYIYYRGARYIRIDLGGLTGGVYTSGTVYNSDMTSVGTFTGMEVETAGKLAFAQRNSNLRLYSAEIQLPTAQNVPGVPTNVIATAGNAFASIGFTAPVDNGGSAILDYTVTSSPGGLTATGTSSPLVVTGLTNGTTYTFTVKARNTLGSSSSSSASNSVTPFDFVAFNDNFDNGTLTGWTSISGTWSNPGAFVQGDWNGGNGQIIKNDIVGTNFIYEADIKLTTATPAGVLTFRGNNDGSNTYLIALDGGSSLVKLYTFPYAVLATSPYTFATDTWYHLKIVTNGTSIKVYFDNALTPVIDITDATFATGKFGLNSWAGVALFDNVKAEPLPGLPGAPTGVVATAGNTQASVAFTAPTSDGGSAILDYTVTSSPGGFTATGTTSPLVVSGLSNGTSYTFTVTARNNRDNGAASSVSSAITPHATNNNIAVSSATNISALTLTSVSDVVVTSNKLIINAATTVNSITVAPGAELQLTSGNTLTAGTVTLQSDATGTATLVDNTTTTPQAVTATVQQYVTSGRNWYMSIPLASGASSLLSRGTSVVCYDEPNSSWIAPAANTLEKMRGYIQTATTTPLTGTTGTVDFTGVVNTGAHSILLSRTTGQTGFNLVGNPYPSYLDWNAVTRTNVLPTMWYRTKEGGVYKFYTFVANGSAGVGSPATVTNKIPPMQAFWVRVNTEGTGSIAVDNTMRAHKDVAGNNMKAPSQTPQKLLRLQVSNGTNTDETVLYFNANASDAFDQYDAQKRSNGEPTVPEIFTQVGTEQLVINGMSQVKYNTEIPIGFSTEQANDFSISANELSNFEAGTKVILIDKQNPTVETELSNGTVYNFSAPITSASTNRFSLLFRAPVVNTGIDNSTKLNAQVFVNAANQITIIAPEKATYSIYNTMGQIVNNGLTLSNRTLISHKFTNAMYVVRVAENGKELTTRVIIK